MSRREPVREIATAVQVILRTAPAQVRQRVGLRNPDALGEDARVAKILPAASRVDHRR
jgi:hypothetical protein